jgi:hypothetical protein
VQSAALGRKKEKKMILRWFLPNMVCGSIKQKMMNIAKKIE